MNFKVWVFSFRAFVAQSAVGVYETPVVQQVKPSQPNRELPKDFFSKAAISFAIGDRVQSTLHVFCQFLPPSPPCTLNSVTTMAGPPLPPKMQRTLYTAPK